MTDTTDPKPRPSGFDPVRWLEAFTLLSIWNPDLWDMYPCPRTKARYRLYYRCRGIVSHDRILNGEPA